MKFDIRQFFGTTVVLLLISATLSGFQYRKGTELYLTDDFQEDLFLSGSTINFSGNIWGDIVGVGRIITFDGMMDGNLMAAAQRITVNGEICRGIRCFAQTININARIDGDAVAFGQDVTLATESKVGRDCALFGAEVYLDGTVERDAHLRGTRVTVAGRVNGNVTITASQVIISPGAVIGGDLNYTCNEKATISPQAQIDGERKWKKSARATEGSESSSWIPFPTGAFWSAIFFAGSLIFGMIMLLLKRDLITDLIQEIKTNTLIDGLVGLLVVVVMPLILVLIGATLIGIPVAVAGLTFYGLLFLAARIIVGITIGMILLRFLKKSGRISLGWSLLLGMILLAILYKIPVVGWIVYILAWAIGAGAMTMLLLRKKKASGVEQALTGKV
jgi:cytoskeletal protein CcmA (bactofilin family)